MKLQKTLMANRLKTLVHTKNARAGQLEREARMKKKRSSCAASA